MPPKQKKQKVSINKPLTELFEQHWDYSQEGELAVDVVEDEKHFYVQSTVAGALAEHIEITLRGDILTIRGFRTNSLNDESFIAHCEECFWGPFSRSIILPRSFESQNTKGELQNGILLITLQK